MLEKIKIAVAGCAALALTTAAAYADGAPKRGAMKQAAVVEAPFSWTGFYLGGNVGGAWSERSQNVTFPNGNSQVFNFDEDSFAGGVQAGYQVQMGALVFGLEAGLTGFDLAGQRAADGAVVADRTRRSDIDWLFTLTPRIGFAMDKWLVYLKAGYANAEVFNGTTVTSTGAQLTGANRREDGWTIGTGFEVAIAPWVSLGLDYSYVNIEPATRSPNVPQFAPLGSGVSTSSDIDLHLLTARINFKLGSGR